MNENGDGAATAVDLIDDYLDKVEHLLGLIRAQAQELKERCDDDE